MSKVTQLLEAIQEGQPHAAEQLLPLVYAELWRLAAGRLSRESPGQTLQPTALVQEAYFRLVGEGDRERVTEDSTRAVTSSPQKAAVSFTGALRIVV